MGSTNTPAKQQQPALQRCIADQVVKTPQQEQLPPVERFIPSPVDTFDDIFEDNLRLTDAFLTPCRPITYVGRLPPGQSLYLDDKMYRLDEHDIESDKEARRQLKRRNKSLKRKQLTASDISLFAECQPLELTPVPEIELTDSDLELL